MKNIIEKKYKTLYPDSILCKNKLFYRKTNDDLNTFLNNNFTNNDKIHYKFLIKKPHSSIQRSQIRRKSTILKQRPKTSGKNNIKFLIERLAHENYISYNFYDNTKGRLSSQSSRNRNRHNTFKKKIYNIKNNKTLNKENFNILSFDNTNNTNSSKMNFKSNLSIFSNKTNIQRFKRHSTIALEKNKISQLDSFSFSKQNVLSKRSNKLKNSSIQQTPSSTRCMSKMKKSSLKLDYDSLSVNNSIKRNSRNKSAFSMGSNRSKSRNRKNLKANNSGESYLSYKKINLSDIAFNESQRNFHQKLYLRKLNSQIQKFEESNCFYPNEEEIKGNLIAPTKFQRDLFMKDIKRASKYNDFFFKKFPSSLDNLSSLKKTKGKRPQSPHHNFSDEQSKKILNSIEKLNKKLKFSKNYLKNIDFRLRTQYMKRIIDYVVPVEHKVKDIDEEFKDETINYQKNIGKFFIYKGSGVYSGHLSSILRGDKIVKQSIKFDNI